MFGALWITQAALPYLRAQRSGHIIQVSSIGGITAFQNVGIYHASKWALEGFSQALAQEVASFGVHVTLIEPGGFSTDWAGSSARHAEPLPDYAEAHAEADRIRNQRVSKPGDPKASAAAHPQVVDADGAAAAGVLRRVADSVRQGRLRAADQDLGAVAAGGGVGAGLTREAPTCGPCRQRLVTRGGGVVVRAGRVGPRDYSAARSPPAPPVTAS